MGCCGNTNWDLVKYLKSEPIQTADLESKKKKKVVEKNWLPFRVKLGHVDTVVQILYKPDDFKMPMKDFAEIIETKAFKARAAEIPGDELEYCGMKIKYRIIY